VIFVILAWFAASPVIFIPGNLVYRITVRRVRMLTFMSPGAAKSERRRKFRKRPLTLVYVELAATNGGMMRDLSEEGFALRAMMPLRAGEKTPFSFSLSESARIEGEGEILWTGEEGRVAGIRFGQISALARTQIHDWLSGTLDLRKHNEASAKPETPHAPTLEQLREELRSVPARGEAPESAQVASPVQAPKIPLTSPEAIAARPLPEAAPPSLSAKESRDTYHSATVERPAVAAQIPSLPRSPQAPGISSPAEPNPSSPVPRNDTLPPMRLPEPLPLPEIDESEALPLQTDPALPDISEILIQPHGRGKGFTPNTSDLETWASLEHPSVTPRASWADWFTLTRAIGIMLLLTAGVAISAYHREVGQGLIWLGEQMGGAHAVQTTPPAAEGAVSTAMSSDQPPRSQPPTSAKAKTANPNDASGSAGVHDNQQTSLPTLTQDTPPPVTPLSGISRFPSSEANQDTGQREYVQAMQLLRGKNAAADTPEAVRLLWISVEKGHPGAEVELADLYWHGRGVVRNCDQTRILLSAAARKGNAEAQKRLQQFQREGCE
jgi:hypothetical protein